MTRRTRLLATLLGCGIALGCWIAANVYPDATYHFLSLATNRISSLVSSSRAVIHLDSFPVTKPVLLATAQPYKDSDGYTVLGAWRRLDNHPGTVLIRQETSLYEPIQERIQDESLRACLTEPIYAQYASALTDLKKVNSRPWLLERSLPDGRSYALTPLADIEGTRYVVVSAVGFSSDTTRAVLFVAEYDRGFSKSDFYLFRRSGAQWSRVRTAHCGWIT